jgi:hypothetical protein
MKNLNNDEKYVSYENVIYRLAGYEVYEYRDASYPNFKTLKTEESFYTSFEEAEKRIAELVENKERTQSHWHSFMIDQVPVGVNCSSEAYQIRRTYSFDGSFVMQSYESHLEDVNGHFETFWGRDEKDIIFESGEIVEVHYGSHVSLEIIVRVPGDKESTREWLTGCDGEEGFRQTRDGYTTLSRWDDNYDMDREATDCFPAATFPVDECHQKELFEIYEKYVSAWNETENDK